jgi:V8-like Glu-specific endopeptidase
LVSFSLLSRVNQQASEAGNTISIIGYQKKNQSKQWMKQGKFSLTGKSINQF